VDVRRRSKFRGGGCKAADPNANIICTCISRSQLGAGASRQSLGKLAAREALSVCRSLGALPSPCSVMKVPFVHELDACRAGGLLACPIAAPPMEPPADATPGGRSAYLVEGWGEGEGEGEG